MRFCGRFIVVVAALGRTFRIETNHADTHKWLIDHKRVIKTSEGTPLLRVRLCRNLFWRVNLDENDARSTGLNSPTTTSLGSVEDATELRCIYLDKLHFTDGIMLSHKRRTPGEISLGVFREVCAAGPIFDIQIFTMAGRF